jgi:hypothetical protein
MYEYLSQHPQVIKGKQRETHYFDWEFNSNISEHDVEAHRNWYLQHYYPEDVFKKHPSFCVGESSPSYMLYG